MAKRAHGNAQGARSNGQGKSRKHSQKLFAQPLVRKTIKGWLGIP